MAAIPVSRGMENSTAFSTGDFAARRPLTPALSLRERGLAVQAFSSITPANQGAAVHLP